MKPALRGKYLGTEHAAELRRIIPALPIVIAVVGDLPLPGDADGVRAVPADTVPDADCA
jgi:hypothetical protein